MQPNQNLQNVAMKIKQMEQQIQAVQKRQSQITQQISEIDATKDGVRELSNREEQDAITPIGKNVYAPSEIKNTNRVLVDVGYGIVLEKDSSKAVNILKDRKDKLLDAKKQVQNQLQQLQQQYQQLASKLSQAQQNMNE